MKKSIILTIILCLGFVSAVDFNGDNNIDFIDLNVVLSNLGNQNASFSEGDINRDGVTDFIDLNILLTFYGMQNITFDKNPVEITECQNIVSPGFYHLTNSLESNGTCIKVNSSNVYLDCKNNAITFSLTEQGSGIEAINISQLLISNCDIKSNFINSIGINLERTAKIKIIKNNLSISEQSLSILADKSNEIEIQNINSDTNLSIKITDTQETIIKFLEKSSLEIINSDNIQLIDSLITNYNLQNVTNLIFEKSQFGSVKFLETISSENISLENNFNIKLLNIFFGNDENLNKKAIISFFNVSDNFNNPLLRNGEPCQNCEIVEANQNKLKAIVNNSGSYSIESIQTSQPTNNEQPEEEGGRCFTNWGCSEWSSCENGQQFRTCEKTLVQCRTRTPEPLETQTCQVLQPLSTPQPTGLIEGLANNVNLLTGAVIGAGKNIGTPIGVSLAIFIVLSSTLGIILITKFKNKKIKE